MTHFANFSRPGENDPYVAAEVEVLWSTSHFSSPNVVSDNDDLQWQNHTFSVLVLGSWLGSNHRAGPLGLFEKRELFELQQNALILQGSVQILRQPNGGGFQHSNFGLI